jgi:hypothetical protein
MRGKRRRKAGARRFPCSSAKPLENGRGVVRAPKEGEQTPKPEGEKKKLQVKFLELVVLIYLLAHYLEYRYGQLPY